MELADRRDDMLAARADAHLERPARGEEGGTWVAREKERGARSECGEEAAKRQGHTKQLGDGIAHSSRARVQEATRGSTTGEALSSDK